ncbi:MAG: hypothetical protein HN837_10110 [Chloroflexi bacterium]|jgi:Zn finger protein HypA/HybF involved in hydrogenase expression|nr:hypothetical protein [Chloroflexota bacterium]MBT7290825.1 hypothetical protein [Chloroflexota bacterium]
MTKCDIVCHQCGMDSDEIRSDYDNIKCPYCGSHEVEMDMSALAFSLKIYPMVG